MNADEFGSLFHEIQSVGLGFVAGHEGVRESVVDQAGELRRKSGVSRHRVASGLLQRVNGPIRLLRWHIRRRWYRVNRGVN